MLIFSIEEQYNKLMEKGFERFANFRDLGILAKKWISEGCVDDSILKNRMFDFCKKWNSSFVYSKSEPLFEKVLKDVRNGEDREKRSLEIGLTENELSVLRGIKELKCQKVYFVMLCIAKWKGLNNLYLNASAVIKLKDIFDLAGVKTTNKNQELILHELNLSGLISIDLKPLCKISIKDIDFDGEVVDRFTVGNGLMGGFLRASSHRCICCGSVYERRSNRQKYCAKCAQDIVRKQKLEYWHRNH